MRKIPDFYEAELWVIRNLLTERYREDKELIPADSEIRLSPGDRELTECPAVYWEALPAHFVVFKTGQERYRCQFFYRSQEQFGTGIAEFDNIGDCVTALLRAQADHQAKQNA